jgi:hypothetical protein
MPRVVECASDSGVEAALTSFEWVETQAPSRRPVPAVHGIDGFIPAKRAHKLESAAFECLIERKLGVGVSSQ